MRLTETKKGELAFTLGLKLAEWTGLEPATPGVTGRYSNQLNYHSVLPRQSADEALQLIQRARANAAVLVGADGLEPPTFAL